MGSNSCVLTNRVLLFCQVGKLSTADAVRGDGGDDSSCRSTGTFAAVRIMMA